MGIRIMRVALGVAALTLALTSCTPSPAPSTPATHSVAPPTPTEAEAAPSPAVGPPDLCVTYTMDPPIVQADGGDAIAAAAASAELSPTVVLNPGVQTIESVDEPGMIEAIARVCSDVMSGSDLRDVASSIAVAIKSASTSDRLSVLVVSAWSPGVGGQLEQGESVRTEYQTYTWDPSAAVPLSENWE